MFRIVQGVGAAVLVPVSLALLLPLWPSHRRGTAIGVWGSAGALAAGTGPALGGILTEASWRWIFLINLPLGAVIALVAHLRLDETRQRDGVKVDAGGVVLLAAAVGAVALAVTQSPAWGWGSPQTIALLVVAIATVPALIHLERRSDEPILDLGLFRFRSFTVGTAASTLFYFAFFGYALVCVLFLQAAWGWSPAKAGIAYGVGPVFSAAVNIWGGRLVDRFGSRTVGAIGLGLYALTFAILGLAVAGSTSGDDYATRFLPAILLGGLSMSMVFPALTSVVTSDVPPALLATGNGVLNTIRQVGGVLGIATVVALVGSLPHDATAFRDAFALLGAGVAVSFLAVLALARRPPESR